MNCIKKSGEYINKIIRFEYASGCIPANALCFCYELVGDYYWVHFKEPILGMQDIKLHKKVIEEHGLIVGSSN